MLFNVFNNDFIQNNRYKVIGGMKVLSFIWLFNSITGKSLDTSLTSQEKREGDRNANWMCGSMFSFEFILLIYKKISLNQAIACIKRIIT